MPKEAQVTGGIDGVRQVVREQIADGALGAHTYAVSDAYKDFKNVAIKIAKNAGLIEL